jgi:hypothetical protein
MNDAGISVKNYREIINKPPNYRTGIPILVRNMKMNSYDSLLRNFMAQAIAMKEAGSYWDELVDFFKQLGVSKDESIVKQGVAVAIGLSFPPKRLSDLIKLCRHQEFGDVRILMAMGLKRSRDPQAWDALCNLADDPQIGPQITKWIKQREKKRQKQSSQKH